MRDLAAGTRDSHPLPQAKRRSEPSDRSGYILVEKVRSNTRCIFWWIRWHETTPVAPVVNLSYRALHEPAIDKQALEFRGTYPVLPHLLK
jgi:hypothetical protein